MKTILWRTVCYLIYSFTIACWGVSKLSAQMLEVDFSNGEELKKSGWFGDLGFYKLEKEELRLDGLASSGGKKQATIALPVQLSGSLHWQGELILDKQPTRYFHHYIILGKKKNTQRKFYALKIGEVISLVAFSWSISENTSGASFFAEPEAEKALVAITPYQLSAGEHLIFDVYFNKDRGWDIIITRPEATEGAKSIHRQFKQERENSFQEANHIALMSYYTKTSRNALAIKSIKIDNELPLSPTKEEEPTPTPLPKDENTDQPEDTGEERIAQRLRINEIMAHPLGGAPEYIELYNADPEGIDMKDYYLVYSSDGKTGVSYPLKDLGLIASGAYLVLTPEKQAFLEAYPETPKDCIRAFPLRQLANKGFTLLLKFREEQLVDEVSYDPSLFPKGLKSKAGVAWERVEVDGNQWQVGASEKLYRSPGLKNSTIRSSGDKSNPSRTNPVEPISRDDSDWQEALQKLLKEYSQGELLLEAFDISASRVLQISYRDQEAKEVLRQLLESPVLLSKLLVAHKLYGPFVFKLTLADTSTSYKIYQAR